MPLTIPCLWVDGQAEQAAAPYASVFPRSEVLGVTRYGPGMPGPEGSVMTVEWSLDGQRYLGLDGGLQIPFSEAVSFQVMCADQEEVDHYWDRLSEGGEQGPCGWLKDRFGVSWQVVPVVVEELMKDPERAGPALQGAMAQSRPDIAGTRAGGGGRDVRTRLTGRPRPDCRCSVPGCSPGGPARRGRT